MRGFQETTIGFWNWESIRFQSGLLKESLSELNFIASWPNFRRTTLGTDFQQDSLVFSRRSFYKNHYRIDA